MKLFNKRTQLLKMLPEHDIMVILKDFDITKERKKKKMIALALVDKSNLTRISGKNCRFKSKPEKIILFNANNKVHSILKKYRNSDKVIVKVSIQDIFSSIVLDMRSYKSVKETYECLKRLGYEIASDEELIKYATTDLCPRFRYVRCEKKLGKEAFKGSNVKEHTLESLVCYDTDLILNMQIIE